MAANHDIERQQHQAEVQKLRERLAVLSERTTYTTDAKKKVEDELRNISEKMIDLKVAFYSP